MSGVDPDANSNGGAECPSSSPAVTAHELSLSRIIDAPPEAVYKACTEPQLLKQWFAPSPYTTPVAELDVRPGGTQRIIMQRPDGTDMPPAYGVYLDVVPNERLVYTDAYSAAWVPTEKPFMTVILTFDKHNENKTKYTARVLHWTAADLEQHEQMGFHTGWGQCADQLVALVSKR
jgi:uncharacterized protein YndB with AHSA1/START domain